MIVYALSVGRGILAIAPMPGADGSYASGLAHLVDWKPAMVVSLVTDMELMTAGALRLGADLSASGTRWEHLPIADFGVPDAAFEETWPEVSAHMRRALAGGGRVLLHCRAGCGRSGMVALRVMVEMGEAPDDALARLRAVRPCAVETDDQLRWACDVRREPAQFMRHKP